VRGEEEREGDTNKGRTQPEREGEERGGEREVYTEERTPRPTTRRRGRDRTDDSLKDMVVTSPTCHEDRSWLKASA
jgi:hypothetical protein